MPTKIDKNFLGETIRVLQEYIRIDTTNPPGNEIETAKFLAGILKDEGLGPRIEESAPGRANLFATLKGKGNSKPVILLNHMDVVPVEAKKWSVPPFSGEIRGGYVYGRGTIDMKGMGILELMALIYLKRKGIIPEQDLIFLAVADEETGGVMGAKWVLENHPELLDVEGVINEGGGGVIYEEKRWYEVSTSQKVICQTKFKTRGEGGHASVPKISSAITKLVEALDRLRHHIFPYELIPTVKEYFSRVAPLQKDTWQPLFADIEQAIAHENPILNEIMEEPNYHSITHNTAAITVLQAGKKVNVIPTEATARVDCRLIPGTSPDAFLETLRSIVINPEVTIETTFKGLDNPPSPHDTRLFHAIEKAVELHDPGAIVTPHLVPGATDSRYFRAAGINCYDFIPFQLPVEERMLIHGIDERISIENMAFGVEMMIDILLSLQSG
jgi:acetylornithine deacetylase/succinyl-diaminopimelate desuccinylase-like protein